MNKCKTILSAFLLCTNLVTSQTSFAQTISGIWNGKVFAKGNDGDTVLISIEIKETEKGANQFSGYSICMDNNNRHNNFYAKTGIAGKFDQKTKKYILEENELIETSVSKKLPIFFDRYILNFSSTNKDKLSGKCLCINNDSIKQKFPWAPCHEEYIVLLTRSANPLSTDLFKKTNVHYDTVWLDKPRVNKNDTWQQNHP